MVFAGLWEEFRWPDGTIARTFTTIITTEANGVFWPNPAHSFPPWALI